MLKHTAVVVGILAAVMAGVWIQQAMSQESSAPKAPAAPKATATVTASAATTTTAPAVSATATATAGPGGRFAKMDPEAMKQAAEKMRTGMLDRMKEQLGSTEDEWKILQPRLEKVMNLAMQSRLGGTSLGGMGFIGRLSGAAAGPSAIDTAGQNLQKLLGDKESKPEDLKAALSTLREARAKARAELETAQKELREVLTMRQEAQLVSMGLLD